jgi:hypothetical protein
LEQTSFEIDMSSFASQDNKHGRGGMTSSFALIRSRAHARIYLSQRVQLLFAFVAQRAHRVAVLGLQRLHLALALRKHLWESGADERVG